MISGVASNPGTANAGIEIDEGVIYENLIGTPSKVGSGYQWPDRTKWIELIGQTFNR